METDPEAGAGGMFWEIKGSRMGVLGGRTEIPPSKFARDRHTYRDSPNVANGNWDTLRPAANRQPHVLALPLVHKKLRFL